MSGAAPSSGRGACRDCRFFEGSALALERASPALAALSSAHGAGRSDDGLCTHHDRYVRARATCASFRLEADASVTDFHFHRHSGKRAALIRNPVTPPWKRL